MLHVTNGDHAVAVLQAAGMEGEFLPWRDVLHEGPLEPSLPLERFSAIRSRFIAEMGWGEQDEVEKQFRERDERLQRAGRDDEVVLWFEHDLYDQLQLLQVLSWFHEHPHPRLSLVCEAEYLGEMAPSRAAVLFEARKAVTPKQLSTAAMAWKALPGVARGDLSALPFLAAALERYRQEPRRTEELIVEELAGGPLGLADLFRRTQARDEPRFLGDTVFLKRLERLEALGRVRRIGERWAIA
ncbi:MAG TPA: DUF1835 domain-containing protein [Burkholderiales bacterium]|nr:DUF1835 domain-containing protein [Burkholderiales bacterium]